MARVSKRWRLDIYAGMTPVVPSLEDITEALYALSIEGEPEQLRPFAEHIVGTPLAPVLIALVKHIARSGVYLAVELDGPSFMDDVEVTARAPGE